MANLYANLFHMNLFLRTESDNFAVEELGWTRRDGGGGAASSLCLKGSGNNVSVWLEGPSDPGSIQTRRLHLLEATRSFL